MLRLVSSWLLVLAACGKGGDKPAPTTAAPAGAAADAKVAPAPVEEPKPPTEQPATVQPLANQLGHKMTEFVFLGWTADGAQFALATMHGPYVGADGDQYGEPTEKEVRVMRMKVVYDAASEKAIAAFRVSNKLPAGVKAKYEAVWSEAQPEAAWKQWTADHPLVRPKPSLKSPDGAWKLTMTLIRAPTRTHDDLEPTIKGGGFYYRWQPWKDVCGDEDCHDDDLEPFERPAIPSGIDTSDAITPRWTLALVKGSDKRPLLDYDAPFGSAHPLGDPGYGIRGNLRVFWSPNADRVLIATFQKLDEVSTAREAAFFVRPTGAAR